MSFIYIEWFKTKIKHKSSKYSLLSDIDLKKKVDSATTALIVKQFRYKFSEVK